jgi:hypothetical protein
MTRQLHLTIATSILPWNDFHGWQRTPGMMLLLLSEALFHIIPLRDVAAQQAADDMASHLDSAGVPLKEKP